MRGSGARVCHSVFGSLKSLSFDRLFDFRSIHTKRDICLYVFFYMRTPSF